MLASENDTQPRLAARIGVGEALAARCDAGVFPHDLEISFTARAMVEPCFIRLADMS